MASIKALERMLCQAKASAKALKALAAQLSEQGLKKESAKAHQLTDTVHKLEYALRMQICAKMARQHKPVTVTVKVTIPTANISPNAVVVFGD